MQKCNGRQSYEHNKEPVCKLGLWCLAFISLIIYMYCYLEDQHDQNRKVYLN